MKKLCFFSGDITRSGGTERVASMIANELIEQSQYEICFLSLCEQRAESFFALDSRIKRYKLGEKWLNPGVSYISLIPKVRSFIKKYEIDIIIDIDIVLDVLSLPASWGYKTKVVSWEHFNCDYEMSISYRRWILKAFTKYSDHIITLTEGDKKRYGELIKRTKKIDFIYNPMTNKVVHKSDDKEKWIITAVRLVYDKGIDYLSEIALKVLTEYPDWTWYVLGEGDEKAKLKKFIDENHLNGRLIPCGLVDNVESYLAKAGMFVLTSRVEGLPMCLLEAKTYGLPCISFDILTGPNEIICDGINGYLVEPFNCKEMKDKIISLIQDEKCRQRFAKDADINIDKFQLDSIIKKWNKVIESICE